MAIDNKTPLIFKLPDGDIVALPTWDYIINKLEEALTPTLDSIEIINSKLQLIDNKLTQWIEEE
jgi:hypothetical protein